MTWITLADGRTETCRSEADGTELRVLHLGAAPKPGRRSVMERLRAAFEQASA